MPTPSSTAPTSGQNKEYELFCLLRYKRLLYEALYKFFYPCSFVQFFGGL